MIAATAVARRRSFVARLFSQRPSCARREEIPTGISAFESDPFESFTAEYRSRNKRFMDACYQRTFFLTYGRARIMRTFDFCKVIGVAGALAALVAWPGTGQAQLGGVTDPVTSTITNTTGTLTTGAGQASASTAVVMGIVTSLVDTGTLTSPSEPRGAGLPLGSIPGLLTAESLQATTMGWTDQVASEASLSNLAMTVAGTGISADFIQSRALAVSGAAPTGVTSIEGLSIGGVPVSFAGTPNQSISLPGLSVTLNEQTHSASGIIVNALRVRSLDGSTDVVVGSAKAGM